MFEDATDEVAGKIGKTAVAVLVVEEGLAVPPEGHVGVHTRAVVSEERLRHEGSGEAVLPGGVLNDVLEQLHIVCGVEKGIEAVVDFHLATVTNLVVGALQRESNTAQVAAHLVAEILVVVVRSNREISTLETGLVATVGSTVEVEFFAAVPPGFFRVNLVETGVHLGGVADAIEDVEFRLSTEVARVGNTGGNEVFFRFARNVTGVTAVGFAGAGVVDEEFHVEGLGLTEGVEAGAGQVGEERHVGFVNGGEAADGRAVKSEALFHSVHGEISSVNGEVLFHTRQVGEANIDEFDLFSLDVIDNFLRTGKSHGNSPWLRPAFVR